MIIAIDFDGTIVEHDYPRIGAPVQGAIDVVRKLQAAGHQLILWTMRSDTELGEARYYCQMAGIEFFGINQNPDQKSWTDSPKAYAHIYIDDAALGCPLIRDPDGGRPYVNWVAVERMLIERGVL